MCDEMLKMLLKDIFGEDTKEEGETKKEIPTKTEGFDSLVSEEEYEAIKNLNEALVKYVKIHNRKSLDIVLLTKGNLSPYASLQYAMLSSIGEDATKAINMMVGIHTCDKEFLDGFAEDKGLSIEEFNDFMMKQLVLNKILG